MAIIAKFISYDGGIAFSEKVMQIKKSENAPPERIQLPDVASLNVRKPREDADGFIRVSTAEGQRYRIFFEDDQYREAVQFKRRFDALVSELYSEEEDDAEAPPQPSVSKPRPGRRPGRDNRGPQPRVPRFL